MSPAARTSGPHSRDYSSTPTRMTRRHFLLSGPVAFGAAVLGAAAAGSGGALYITQVEPEWVEETHVDVPIANLPPALEGLRIALLGDIHLGPYVEAAYVQNAASRVGALSPDLVVLCGDFVSESAAEADACAQALLPLQSRYGVYAILGNHDIWTDPDYIQRTLNGVGIHVLRDEARQIAIGNSRLWLLGIDDSGYSGFTGSNPERMKPYWQPRVGAVQRLLASLPTEDPRILLIHNPDLNEWLAGERLDLALSGHTHGGQVRLPWIGAPLTPSCYGQKYVSGLVQGPACPVYVNRGLGMKAPPVRFNCRPEITLLTLRTGQSGA
ncbi:MAG: metallophosphoesterase [Anaerolineae bacterium]